MMKKVDIRDDKIIHNDKKTVVSRSVVIPMNDDPGEVTEAWTVRGANENQHRRSLTIAQADGLAQLEHFSREGSIWALIKDGNLDQVTQFLQRRGPTFNYLERGIFRETIVHASILLKKFEIAKYFIKKFPDLVDLTYQSDAYKGENALHMSVANRNEDLTQYLLEHGADPNKGRATGTFFSKNNGTVYYGEHVICFAVCTDQCEMVDLLYENGARLDVCDIHGNSLWHHCVRINSIKMFDQLLLLHQMKDKNYSVNNLNSIRNNDGFSVLQYAVYLGKKSIFEHILEEMKIIGWEWADVAFCAYPLSDIDTHGDNTRSVLETIITEERSSFMFNPVIYEVFTEKWAAYGKTFFQVWFLLHVFYCVIITITGVLLLPIIQGVKDQNNSNIYHVYELPLWVVASLLVMLSKIIMTSITEVVEFAALFQEHGFSRAWHIYFERGRDQSTLSVTGLFKIILWTANVVSCAGVLLVIAGHAMQQLIVLFIILEWLYTIMFAQAYRATGRLVLTISKIIARDLGRFGFIYVIVLFGFSAAMTLLQFHGSNSNINELNPIDDWLDTMFRMYELSVGLGNFSPDFFETPTNLLLAKILHTIYLVICLVMLMNLLIAMMTETTDNVREKAIEQWLLQWASTVLLLERRIPSCWYRRTGVTGSSFGLSDENADTYFITFTQIHQQANDRVLKMFRKSSFYTKG